VSIVKDIACVMEKLQKVSNEVIGYESVVKEFVRQAHEAQAELLLYKEAWKEAKILARLAIMEDDLVFLEKKHGIKVGE
jgi:hypothetical protein